MTIALIEPNFEVRAMYYFQSRIVLVYVFEFVFVFLFAFVYKDICICICIYDP